MFRAFTEDSFVVLVVSNTARFSRRAELFKQCRKSVEDSGIDHVVVELAFGDREFYLTLRNQPNHLQLRTIEEFWHKENLMMLGTQHGRKLWPQKKIVMFHDADCAPIGQSFADWYDETWHMLQHHKVVQMWSWLQHLDYDLNPLGSHKKGFAGSSNPSFMYNYKTFGTPYPADRAPGYPFVWGSPGLAWAFNLSALDEIGGIPDLGITGGGDWYLAHMLISDLDFPQMKDYHPLYVDYWKHRQALCEYWIKRDVGYVNAYMMHYFHGKISNRQYNTREQILINGQFSERDVKRDSQGLWQLETRTPLQIWMRDKLSTYAKSRNEDSIDV